MGREIRRVPPNWEHPKVSHYDTTGRKRGDYQPMYDEPFAPAMREWFKKWEAWERGERPEEAENCATFWEWSGKPPDPEYYRPDWSEQEATWYQVYETVSEGTPVTPPFSTLLELIAYLVQHGDFWDQERGDGGWSREAAEQFAQMTWAPSLVISGTEVRAPRDGMPTAEGATP